MHGITIESALITHCSQATELVYELLLMQFRGSYYFTFISS